MGESRTLFLLLAEYGTGQIPVERCAHHFGLKPTEAKHQAARQRLPVPAFRIGSQKAVWMVSATDLADLIDARHKAAQDEWQRVRNAA